MTFLGVEYGTKYTLTGPDGTVVVFNDTTDPNYVGVLSPESSGLDGFEIREDSAERVEADGAIHGAFFAGRRPVILQGWVTASSATQRNERVGKILQAVRALRADATLKWKPLGASEEVEIKLRLQQPTRAMKGFVKEFQIAMVAADPKIIGVTARTASASEMLSLSVTKTPGEIGEEGEGTEVSWVNPNNAKVSDNAYATNTPAGKQAKTLIGKKYDFTSIPVSAIIKGIEFKPERKQSTTGLGWKDAAARITLEGASPQALPEPHLENEFGTTDSSGQLGGPTSLWGPTYKAAFENAENIRSKLWVYYVPFAAPGGGTVSVDAMPTTVYYETRPVVTAVNEGSAPIYPTIKLTGPVTNPVITNITTGETISYVGTITAGNYVLFNANAGTVLENGVTDRYEKIAFPPTWPSLQIGSNEVRLSGSSGSAATKIELFWQNAWI